MQFQVDAGDSRPTFFELIAADRLVPSLRAALVYSLGVLAARRPGLTRILDHEAEAFAAGPVATPRAPPASTTPPRRATARAGPPR